MSSHYNNRPQNEQELAYRIRYALDEHAAHISPKIANRLRAARKLAIAHKKPELPQIASAPQFAGLHKLSHSFNRPSNWFWRVSTVIPALLLIFGVIGIYFFEQERRINELAELDTAVLGDELPLDAYLDHRFDAYLNKNGD